MALTLPNHHASDSAEVISHRRGRKPPLPRVRRREKESTAAIRRPVWFQTPARASTGNEGNRPDPNLPAGSLADRPITGPRSAISLASNGPAGGLGRSFVSGAGPPEARCAQTVVEEKFVSYPGTARGRSAGAPAKLSRRAHRHEGRLLTVCRPTESAHGDRPGRTAAARLPAGLPDPMDANTGTAWDQEQISEHPTRSAERRLT